jgi:predicted O-methyltransferase YrrM
MSTSGTRAHEAVIDLPELVDRAVRLARQHSFEFSCRPEQGRLLALLAAGRSGGVIGETGTGFGVGLAWMASASSVTTRIVSVESDVERAEAASALFSECPNVKVLHGDWRTLEASGPFDLLVLDGGGHGKGSSEYVDPTEWLNPLGMVVVDDLTPALTWPATWEGQLDEARMHWFDHAALATTELRLAADLATLVGLRIR